MKRYILMTLATATALSPVAAHAAPVAPVRADVMVEDFSDFQREGRRAERQEARANQAPEQPAERRAERPQITPERAQAWQEPEPVAEIVNRAAPQRDSVRTERQRDDVRTERRDLRQDGRYFDRNRDGRLDRRFDRNDDERIDRRYDRNRDGRLDRNQIGRWTNGWRNDNRYNWRKYREQNRNYYRPGRYYAPYRDRNYSRISIGFSLGSAFFGSRYWINNPWQYRLPAAYGSYRWVRYYDDVLLVDVRNGRVVDVIRDFFW